MTASVERLDWDLMERITQRITTEVKGINRVLCDLTPKPCATIEWE
jgi:GMP synthase (glutamine-hydrolysing)